MVCLPRTKHQGPASTLCFPLFFLPRATTMSMLLLLSLGQGIFNLKKPWVRSPTQTILFSTWPLPVTSWRMAGQQDALRGW